VSYARLNWIVRAVLVASVAITLLFFVMAARPTPRFRGTVLGGVGQDIPLYNDEDQVVLTVRLENPAVVTFPAEWGKGDEFCGVFTFRRGEGRLRRTVDEELAQSLWDQRGDTDMVIAFNNIVARTLELYALTPPDRALPGLIRERLGYTVLWFDEYEPIYLPDQRAVSRLLCYHFRTADTDAPRLPDVHVIRFNPRNAQTTRRGGFYIRYQSQVTAEDPPQAFRVERIGIAEYLRQVRAGETGASVVKAE
jgi:hypothetical protein